MRLSYGQKIFLLATLPLVVAVAAIALVVADQSRRLAESEIAALERHLIEAKKAELKNYVSLARTAIGNIYGRAAPDDATAKLRVSQILAAMIYGQDGYFFVFDYDGNNIVAPRRTELIGRNWLDLTDAEGTEVVAGLIAAARSGTGYHAFLWPKPSTGEPARMIAYVTGLQDWRWVVGTGIFVDDIEARVAATRAATQARVAATFLWIGAITLAALLAVFLTGLFINLRERRLADAKLKELTQRIVDTQEEERARVARELHDSISQLLISVRYALDVAQRRLGDAEPAARTMLEKAREALRTAISEVRRISRDLRPGVLDDLGLGPALKALVDDFSARTGIATEFETAVFRNRLDREAKIALYRVAQEALTNIERHAGATRVSLKVTGHRRGAILRIEDDGCGISPRDRASGGLGLRNMQERIEQLDGTLRIVSAPGGGTIIEAQVPLTHLLPPEKNLKDSA